MDLVKITNLVKNIANNGMFGDTIVVMTTPTWCGKTLENPYVIAHKDGKKIVIDRERVTKVTTYKNILLGGNYTNIVKHHLEKSGADATEWSTQKSYLNPYLYPYLFTSKNDDKQYYLRATIRNKTTKIESIFFLDGKLATKEEVEDIKQYLKPTYQKQKQLECGMAEEEQVFPLNIKLQSIMSITHNGIVTK